jgi:hypothetical protein
LGEHQQHEHKEEFAPGHPAHKGAERAGCQHRGHEHDTKKPQGAVGGRKHCGHGDRRDQSDSGNDQGFESAVARFAMAVKRRQGSERGVYGEIEPVDGVEREQGQPDRDADPHGNLDVVWARIARQTQPPVFNLQETRAE